MKKNNKNVMNVMTVAGALMVLVGAASFAARWFLSPYVYSVGAILFVIPQLMDRYEGTNVTIRRLRRQQMLGSFFLLATALLMFKPWLPWILSLTIAAVLELYTAFRLSAELGKRKN